MEVSREWFERAMELWDFKKLGCPMCGDQSKPMVKSRTVGFATRYGCSVCDRWFNQAELID